MQLRLYAHQCRCKNLFCIFRIQIFAKMVISNLHLYFSNLHLYLLSKYSLIDDQPSCGSSLKNALELLKKLPPLFFSSILSILLFADFVCLNFPFAEFNYCAATKSLLFFHFKSNLGPFTFIIYYFTIIISSILEEEDQTNTQKLVQGVSEKTLFKDL